MALRCRNNRSYALGIAIALSAAVFVEALSEKHLYKAEAQTSASSFEPNEATKARLQNIVKGILAAWDKADVVCLGEDHGSKNDSEQVAQADRNQRACHLITGEKRISLSLSTL